MIPNANSPIYHTAKYLLLEEGDHILDGDYYYNNFTDNWLPVEKEFLGNEYRTDESKPIKRINDSYQERVYYQPEFIDGNPPFYDGVELYSFEVYHSKEEAQKDFPNHKIIEYSGNDIEDPTFVDED